MRHAIASRAKGQGVCRATGLAWHRATLSLAVRLHMLHTSTNGVKCSTRSPFSILIELGFGHS